MTFQTGIDFSDGNVSTDKMNALSSNHDGLYNDLINKPTGILGLMQRTTDWTNPGGTNYHIYFDQYSQGLKVTPPTGNRLLSLNLYIPYHWGTNAYPTATQPPLVTIQRDGTSLYVNGFNELMTGNAYGQGNSMLFCAFDNIVDLKDYYYNITIYDDNTAAQGNIDNTNFGPSQFWVEDLGPWSAV